MWFGTLGPGLVTEAFGACSRGSNDSTLSCSTTLSHSQAARALCSLRLDAPLPRLGVLDVVRTAACTDDRWTENVITFSWFWFHFQLVTHRFVSLLPHCFSLTCIVRLVQHPHTSLAGSTRGGCAKRVTASGCIMHDFSSNFGINIYSVLESLDKRTSIWS